MVVMNSPFFQQVPQHNLQHTPQPQPGRQPARRGWASRFHTATALSYAVGFPIIMCMVFFFGKLMNNNAIIAAFGIRPLDFSAIWHIFTAPFIHIDIAHLISNLSVGVVLCWCIGLSGHRVFLEVTAIVCLISGLGTWLLGGVGTVHVGASGIIYGWLLYLIVRGFFNRSFSQSVMGFVLILLYSGLMWGVLPGTQGVSWQAHFFGALGGLCAGAILTSDDPPARKAQRATQESTQRGYGELR
ncbi:rhomboid family intramembrane serine protease [Corynebacterium sp. sy039]|uniref:rhomboid family intramembrane serine protease n=1 Tax=Corynebacterium sp. sy039 TaxID=2599641 RepID=UPI001FEEDFB7|nr:rhomboid family intramembrane serine protease [Corynebacterium sp. sy039]